MDSTGVSLQESVWVWEWLHARALYCTFFFCTVKYVYVYVCNACGRSDFCVVSTIGQYFLASCRESRLNIESTNPVRVQYASFGSAGDYICAGDACVSACIYVQTCLVNVWCTSSICGAMLHHSLTCLWFNEFSFNTIMLLCCTHFYTYIHTLACVCVWQGVCISVDGVCLCRRLMAAAGHHLWLSFPSGLLWLQIVPLESGCECQRWSDKQSTAFSVL